jgi:hypothetical protein
MKWKLKNNTRINETESWFFEMMYEIDKLLAKVTKRKRRQKLVLEMRSVRGQKLILKIKEGTL